MIIPVCLAVAAGILALVLLAVLAATIRGDGAASPAGQRAKLARLTAPLPPVPVPGRHRPIYVDARGTEAQRRLYDTMEISLADIAEAVAR
jgi:hypothetical protein